MSAVIIPFPTPAQVDGGDTRTCLDCVNARFGRTTVCILANETITDETEVASHCEAFEKEQEQ